MSSHTLIAPLSLSAEHFVPSGSTLNIRSNARDEDLNSIVEREEYGPAPGEKGWDQYEVRFDENDLENPLNWPRWQRWYITVFGGLLVLNATFASSTPSGMLPQLMTHFGFSHEVGSLLIALFVAGYCVGPLLWGPLSEQYGRKPIFIITFTCYTAFQVGCALSPNTGSILAFRFLGGIFAAAPLTNSGALVSDIWDASTRGKALAFFSLAPFAGPTLGPIVSGFMAVRGVSWHWIFWVLTIFTGTCLALIILTLPETHTPVILVRKAKRLRKETGDDRWWAPMERNRIGFEKQVESILARPFKILFTEPMLLAITLYMSFVYGCLYLLFEAYPIVFTQARHFNAGISGLMFLPIFIGGCAACFAYVIYWNPIYERAVEQYKPESVPPEYRLDQCLYAAPIFAISFFWFGWTSYPNVSYWAPMMAGFPMGFAIVLIFLGLFSYIIDTYLFIAASALASSTVIRSLFGAGFPLFATQMYEQLNPRWASTLLGCLAILMAPIPFVLKRYGPILRQKSKLTPTPSADILKAQVGEEAV